MMERGLRSPVEENNYQRLVRLDVNVTAQAIRFVPESTWGVKWAHIFAYDIS